MAVTRDVLESIHERRCSANPGSDLFATVDPYAITLREQAAGVTPINFSYLPGNVLRYQANKTPGTTDMQAGFQNAASSNDAITIPDGTYKIGSTVSISVNNVLIGAHRSTVIINGPASTPCFQLLTPLSGTVYNANLRFENFTLNSFQCIQLNQQGNTTHYGSLASFPTDVFITEGYIVGPVFRHVTINGTYTPGSDPNADTNKWPTTNSTTPPAQYANPTDLIAFGFGIMAVKTFDMYIEESCLFTNLGVAILLDGSDINNIGGRFQTNARHVHVLAHDTFGFSNKITGRDVLANRRRGAIYVDSALATEISGNFFECALALNGNNSDAAGTFIATQFDINTKISLNRFEPNRIGTAAGSPEVDVSPAYGMVFTGNSSEYTPSLPGTQIQVRSTNYWNPANAVGEAGTNSFFMKFSGNSPSIPPPVWISAVGLSYPLCPHVELDDNDPLVFDVRNPKNLSNTGAATFPWKISGTTGRPCISTSNQPLNVQFQCRPSDSLLCVRIRGTWVSGGGFIAITWGGVTVFSQSFGFASGGNQIMDQTIRRPAAQQGVQPIIVQIADAAVEYESIMLFSTEDEILNAAFPITACYYPAGTRVWDPTVTSTGSPGKICTTAGVGGTAVFTAMPVL